LTIALVTIFAWTVLGNTPMVLMVVVIFGVGLLFATLADRSSGQY
jgi:hypothetical protein